MAQESKTPRRTFLALLTAIGSVAAAALVVIPGVGYLAGALRRDKTFWVKLGPISGFPQGETRLVTFKNPLAQSWDGVTAQSGVYVKFLGHDASYDNQFQVLAVNCTHLGCAVEWFPQSGLFMCPCHGGVYYENGDRASGPPPRRLYRCEWRITDGDLEVQAPHLPTLQNTLRDGDRIA